MIKGAALGKKHQLFLFICFVFVGTIFWVSVSHAGTGRKRDCSGFGQTFSSQSDFILWQTRCFELSRQEIAEENANAGNNNTATGTSSGTAESNNITIPGTNTNVTIPSTQLSPELNEAIAAAQAGATTVQEAIALGAELKRFVENPIGTVTDAAKEAATNAVKDVLAGKSPELLGDFADALGVTGTADFIQRVGGAEFAESFGGEAFSKLADGLGEGVAAISDAAGELMEALPVNEIAGFFSSAGEGLLKIVPGGSIQEALTQLPVGQAVDVIAGLDPGQLASIPADAIPRDVFRALPQDIQLKIPGGGDGSCCGCKSPIQGHHRDIRKAVKSHISAQATAHRQWMLNDFFKQQLLPALMKFTEQMSIVGMHQTMIFGTFLDAKHQLETQRLVQEKYAQAHKDYQPSEDFCYFGTNARSLANSEAKSNFNAYMLSRRQMGRHLGQYNVGGALGPDEDKLARWDQFKEQFCDPKDNNWLPSQTASGMALACGPGSSLEFTNADIDYTRLVETPRTISLLGNGFRNSDFVPDPAANASEFGDTAPNISNAAIMALGNNLYGHNVLARPSSQNLRRKEMQNLYMALRSVAAKRSVAENSFNSIVSMKSAGTTDNNSATADTWQFLGAVLKELGIPENEIQGMIGQEPSYYAQLEVLGKKIYQSPNFFSNLYDKPANIKRKAVAMKAIELMLDRAIYESQLRQEMISSVLLSSRLREPFKEAEQQLQGGQ